jgi:hypothetical protein
MVSGLLPVGSKLRLEVPSLGAARNPRIPNALHHPHGSAEYLKNPARGASAPAVVAKSRVECSALRRDPPTRKRVPERVDHDRTTQNGDGRVFPFTRELRRVLEDQQHVAERLKQQDGLIARYVFCYTTGQKTGQRITESGFNKAWRKAAWPPVPRADSARFSSDRRSQPRASGRAGARGDVADRPQDAIPCSNDTTS